MQASSMLLEFPASPLPALILVKMHRLPIDKMSSSLFNCFAKNTMRFFRFQPGW